jgi:V8-like Glu-specific endopeptidase
MLQGEILMRLLLVLALLSAGLLAKEKIVYGEDGRVEIDQVGDSLIQNLGQAIAARVGNWSFKKKENNISFTDVALLSDRWGAAVCSDELFAKQPTIADCTGFLIADDLLVTAGHCALDGEGEYKNEKTFECSENSWLFDYSMHGSDVDTENMSSDKLYRCKEVVIGELTEKVDFAIIRLDRKVTDREPLKMRSEGKIAKDNGIFVIGHPSGLPMKYSGDASVKINASETYFSTNLDTFGGNSGSPVFNADTLEVEGILVRGRTDYVESEEDGQFCMRVNMCDQNGKNCLYEDPEIDGEHVQRINSVVKHLN